MTTKARPKLISENKLEKWRMETLFTKEPETIAWIESFSEDGIFYDIGANIGVFSLFCAMIRPNMRIVSFEPDIYNFTDLCRNIVLNGFTNITPVYAGAASFSGPCGYDSERIPGSSKIKFKSNGGFDGVLIRLDDIAPMLGYPDYVKIDVDGRESDVISGMPRILDCTKLFSMLIEIDMSNNNNGLLEMIDRNGFVRDEFFDNITPHSTERREAESISVRNVVFTFLGYDAFR